MNTEQDAAHESPLDEDAAASFLNMKPATLRVWRSTGRYNLPYVKVGRSVRYRREDLVAFMERRRVVIAEAA